MRLAHMQAHGCRLMDHVTDVVVGDITPALVDSPRCRSRMVEAVELQMDIGVETLADLAICLPSCKPFVYGVFLSCSYIKH